MEDIIITVDGAPGSGKSRISNWLANTLDEMGHVTKLADNGMEVTHGKPKLTPLDGPLKNQARIIINVKPYPLGSGATVPTKPISMRLNCPECGTLHVDEGGFATKPHHTHSCQNCGLTWRPAVEYTVGVRFLPGFKNETVSA